MIKRVAWSRLLPAMLVALAGLWLLAGCSSQEEAQAQVRLQRPTVVPAKALTPAPTPRDRREVAILTLHVKASAEGKVEAVELVEGKIVRSYAPNVLGLRGPWTVELAGTDTIRFGTLNPLYVRVYGDEEKVPHTGLTLREVTWKLVVPLYDGGRDLKVIRIKIYDQDGNPIFSTPVEREKWGGR